MAVTVTYFICDRDGIQGSGPAGAFPALPEGWTNLNVTGPTGAPIQGHLCPACTAAFQAFMNPSGGSFSLKPSTTT